MNKFTKITNIINTTWGLSEMERQVQTVKKSSLPEDEKYEAYVKCENYKTDDYNLEYIGDR